MVEGDLGAQWFGSLKEKVIWEGDHLMTKGVDD